MDNKYFPKKETKLDFVMRVYENEISTRNEWIKENVDKLNKSLGNQSASISISYAMSIVNNAMLILRLVDRDAIGARDKDNEKAKAKERARILYQRNPNMPKSPISLRKIRNDYEHFESRLDEWATSSNPNIYIDLIVGDSVIKIDGQEDQKQNTFRSLVGTKLIFWNNSIDLQEVVDWVNQMNEVTKEKNRF